MKSNTKKPILGEWIWASTIADAGEGGAEKIISRALEMGVTDLYLLIKGTGGKLSYLKTEHTDIILRENRDVLAEAIAAARAVGIRIHAWICLLRDVAYKEAHPESAQLPYIRENSTQRTDPRDPGYLAHVKSIVREVAAYGIDGLHLDYIRYRGLESGWSDRDFDALAEMGADISRVRELMETTFGYNGRTAKPDHIYDACRAGDRDARIVAKYRRENVKYFAGEVISAAREINPDLLVSAAVMPEGALDDVYADLAFGQNHTDTTELYDYICPMAYSTDLKRDETWVARSAVADIERGNRVVMGLQAFYNAPAKRLTEELDSLDRLALDPRYADALLGAALFRTDSFDYAKHSYDAKSNTAKIKLVTTADTEAPTRIVIDAADGVTIASAALAEGYAEKIEATVSTDGKKAEFTSSDLRPIDGAGEILVSLRGGESADRPIRLSLFGEREICVRNL